MKRPFLTVGLLLPLASLLLTGCGGSPAAKASGDTDGTGSVVLNVGDQKGGSEAILRAAGELDNLKYRIKWSTFTSGPPLLEAINAKAVDVGGVGNTPPVFAAGSGSKITVVGASHGSTEGEALVVPKDSPLKKPADLKGRSIAVAQGSSAHYLVVAALKKAGLGIGDVKLKYLQPADALAAFSRGKVDAWAVWDPYTSQILRTSNARVLTTGRGITNGLAFQVASPGALKDSAKSQAIGDYIDRLERAQAWVFKHPEAWAKVWAKETGLPYEVALDAVRRTNGTRVPVAIDKAAIASEQAIADTFAELKLIPGKVVFEDFVDTRFNKSRPSSGTAPLSYGKASS
ncbi:ABC transporter substrate-binding protein [Streptomyces sp. NPDC091272]|uniref:ABC transporter substrate-binding protein n=1 Tax=Streptomyces sp. NPDC091272 TaxID=3365981 RepID=UPI0037FC8BF6